MTNLVPIFTLSCKILNLNKKLHPQHICPFVVVTYEHEYPISHKKTITFSQDHYAVFVTKTSKYTLIPTTVHTLCQDNHKAILLAINCKLVSKNNFN